MKYTLLSLVIFTLILFVGRRILVDDYKGCSLPTHNVTVYLPGLGKIIGNYSATLWTSKPYLRFLGIPFAESPRGKLRFKAPVPRKSWRRTLDVRSYGRRCPVITTILSLNQKELREDLEDCLSLCVYTKCLSSKFPVMFFVHGGGFSNGSSSDYPPEYLLEKNVVLVVPQFRIGALGWLTTRSKDMPGNAAMADLMLALQWTCDHIHRFGGDPNKITVFGQSSGSAMVGALLLSPKTPKGLMKRVIMQSGSILSSWAINVNPYEQAEWVCKAMGCWACGSQAQIYKCLREASVENIVKASAKQFFSPIVGDLLGIIPKSPSELLRTFNETVSVMMGFTKHEGSFIVAMIYDQMKSLYPNMKRRVNVRKFATQILDRSDEDGGIARNILFSVFFNELLLRSYNHKKALPAYVDLASTLYIKSPIVSFAAQLCQKNLGTVYLYTFDYEGQNSLYGYGFDTKHYPFNGGVHHSNENIYLFPTHKLNWRDRHMAKIMVSLWTSFAYSCIPRSSNAPKILPMRTESGPYFHIDNKIKIGSSVLQEFKAAVNDMKRRKLIKKHKEF